VDALVLEQSIRDAYEFAALAHAGQVRRGSLAPYVTHALAVMNLLVDLGVQDGAMLQAALLHDVIENSGRSLTEIHDRFGATVAALVAELTRPPETYRDPAAFKRYLDALSPRARVIKLANRVDNARGLMAITDDGEFVDRHLEETRALFIGMWADLTHTELASMLRAAVRRAEELRAVRGQHGDAALARHNAEVAHVETEH
jgi:(p)ppGpp synthase/HD superfamily hydrolase